MEIVYEGESTDNDNTDHRLRKFLRRLYLSVHGHVAINAGVFGPWLFVVFFFIYPPFRLIVIVYIVWIYYDRETPYRGGRKSKFIRKLSTWKCMRDYFPIRMVKTAELPADRNYLFAAFPHGTLCYGMGCNILTDANNFDKAYPGLNPHCVSLNGLFYVPVIRDIFLALGICSASKENIARILNGSPGTVCVIMVGGLEEMFGNSPGTYKLVLSKRKGFVRLALQTGASLVPVFSFGETSTLPQPTCKLYRILQKAVKNIMGMPLFIPKGRGYFQDYFGLLPYQIPITTIIGKPIDVPKIENPTEENLTEYHEKYTSELKALFDRFKGKYDQKGQLATLEII